MKSNGTTAALEKELPTEIFKSKELQCRIKGDRIKSVSHAKALLV